MQFSHKDYFCKTNKILQKGGSKFSCKKAELGKIGDGGYY